MFVLRTPEGLWVIIEAVLVQVVVIRRTYRMAIELIMHLLTQRRTICIWDVLSPLKPPHFGSLPDRLRRTPRSSDVAQRAVGNYCKRFFFIENTLCFVLFLHDCLRLLICELWSVTTEVWTVLFRCITVFVVVAVVPDRHISSVAFVYSPCLDQIRNIGKVTQLYVSVDAATRENLKVRLHVTFNVFAYWADFFSFNFPVTVMMWAGWLLWCNILDVYNTAAYSQVPRILRLHRQRINTLMGHRQMCMKRNPF